MRSAFQKGPHETNIYRSSKNTTEKLSKKLQKPSTKNREGRADFEKGAQETNTKALKIKQRSFQITYKGLQNRREDAKRIPKGGLNGRMKPIQKLSK